MIKSDFIVADAESTRTDVEEDGGLDLSLLKELGKTSLVNALNSVRGDRTTWN